MMDDYNELKKLAMAATGQFWNETIDGVMAHGHGSAICHTGALPNHEANKAFIAACGPMPILDLISKYECKAEFLEDFIACHQRQNVKINELNDKLKSITDAAQRYLDFRHTGDIGMGYQFSGIHPQTHLKQEITKAKGL